MEEKQPLRICMCALSRQAEDFIFFSLTIKLTVDFPKMICGLCGLNVYIRKKYVSQIRKKMFFSSQVLKEKKNLIVLFNHFHWLVNVSQTAF